MWVALARPLRFAHLIKQMVAEENPKKPLSDNQITDTLANQGIVVARRTIAKYRESLNIPPANLRKSLSKRIALKIVQFASCKPAPK
jgi:hypothetical protein